MKLASRLNNFFGKTGMRYAQSRAPDLLEKICGGLALVLLGFASFAVFKGRAEWGEIPVTIWVHLVTLAIVLILTPVMMWRKRGDAGHRLLGWIWCICMFVTALVSFNMRFINPGSFSPIHLLSVFAIISVAVMILSARRRDIGRHRSQARSFIIGALLVAGFFTFPFNRLLGNWLFS